MCSVRSASVSGWSGTRPAPCAGLMSSHQGCRALGMGLQHCYHRCSDATVSEHLPRRAAAAEEVAAAAGTSCECLPWCSTTSIGMMGCHHRSSGSRVQGNGAEEWQPEECVLPANKSRKSDVDLWHQQQHGGFIGILPPLAGRPHQQMVCKLKMN